MSSNTSNETNWYANVFKSWQVKLLGSKPTAEMLTQIHGLQARPGKQALACAMALRPEGVTGAQIIMACGAPQLNKMRGFITDALLKREPVPPAANGHKVYKLAVTAKGNQRIERTAKAVAAHDAEGAGKAVVKPAKPVKAKKAVKVKVTESGTSEAVTVTAMPVETAAAEMTV